MNNSMKLIKILSHLLLLGLTLTVGGISGCAQNPATSSTHPIDLPGSPALEPSPIYDEPYVPYRTYSPKATKPKPKTKAKKSAKSSSTTGYVTHTVKAGENLYRIALRYGVSQAAIKSANGLKSNALRLGQKLRIPGGKVSNSQNSSVTRRVAGNGAAKIAVVAPKNIASCSPAPRWGWPSKGTITPTNSGTAKGTAININGSAQSVKAAASGTVTFSGQGTQKRPNRITISHNKSFSTVYEYYGKSLARIGTQVTLGQTIGELNSQTPLHFEIRCHAKALNPLYYLPG